MPEGRAILDAVRGLVALVVASACSIGLDRVPDHVPPGQRVACTDGYLVPIIDATTAVAGTATAIYLQRHQETCGDGEWFCGSDKIFAIPAGIIAVVWGIAAIDGFISVHECRATKRLSQ